MSFLDPLEMQLKPQTTGSSEQNTNFGSPLQLKTSIKEQRDRYNKLRAH